MAEANPGPAPFLLLPFDVHVIIVKLLSLKEALVYAQLTPITKNAVDYVFAHRKQLDFGSVLGPNSQIWLPDATIMRILHAHVRAEAITDFSVQPTFSGFAALKRFMRSHWIPLYDSSGFPTGVGHGVLCNVRYPVNTYCGGATLQQGQKLLAIWNEFHDDYGVFCVDAANFNHIRPLNNAPGNWSIQELGPEEDSDDESIESDREDEGFSEH